MFEKYARKMCQTAKLQYGEYTADQLNYFALQWPEPRKALELMGLGFNDTPLVFLDAPFEFVGKALIQLWDSGNYMWPIGLMPVQHLNIWQDDVQVRMMQEYLRPHGLGVDMRHEPDAILCRGVWAHPCDFRFRFMRGYNYA